MTDFSDIFQVDFLGEAEVWTVDGHCLHAAAVHLSDDGSIPREDSRSIASLSINNSRLLGNWRLCFDAIKFQPINCRSHPIRQGIHLQFN